MKTKIILIIEFLFIIGVLSFLFIYTLPKQIYPLHGMTISNSDFLFEIANSDEIILSPDKDFLNSMFLKEGDEIILPPGTYFWKVKGMLKDSGIKNFTIQSEVSLVLKEKDGSYHLQNLGNVDLNVTKTQGDKITLGTILRVGEIQEFEKEEAVYEGGQL